MLAQHGYQALDDGEGGAKMAPAPLMSSQYEVEQSSKSISNHQALGRNRPPNRPLVAPSAHSISNAQALGRELYPLAVVKPSGCSVVTNLEVGGPSANGNMLTVVSCRFWPITQRQADKRFRT